MVERPLETREGRTNNYTWIAVGLAALVMLFLIFGARMFNNEKSVDANAARPNMETPLTGETKKP